ncbi:MAG: 5-formyltetrahydrofolate cyclo-ligase [Flavobacteriales bacterium]
MTKAEIRTLYKAKRAQLSPYDITKISAQVQALVLDHFSFSSKYVSIFLPIEQQKEISTYGLLEDIILKGGHPILSKANFKDHSLTLYHYEHPSQLEISSFGIPEPKHGRTILAGKLDFVFVPLLGLNSEGQRVGYGKGFYDRLLKQCKPDCIFIGLHLFDEFTEISDLNANDIPLHLCFTPGGVYDFRK